MDNGRPEEEEAPRSQTSFLYNQLRSEIISGRIMPGERLKISEIANRFEVSPGAVREALSRLVPEQLVISRDQRGFLAAPLSLKDLEDLTDLRCEIEAIALRRSVERATLDWEVGIIAASHRLARTPRLVGEPPRMNPEWAQNHMAFHTALVAACGNVRLLELHHQLYEQSERYRAFSVTQEGDPRSVDDEHAAMATAAVARDADALVEAVVSHIRLTTKLIAASARSASLGANEAA